MARGFVEEPTCADDWEKLLGVVAAGIVNRTLEPKVAKEFHNGCGKAIGWTKARLENAHQRGEKPDLAMFRAKK